jgi:hypothetical protein
VCGCVWSVCVCGVCVVVCGLYVCVVCVCVCVCVCVFPNPGFLHDTFNLLSLLRRFWEMFRERNDNTDLPTHRHMCVCVFDVSHRG